MKREQCSVSEHKSVRQKGRNVRVCCPRQVTAN